MATKEVLIIIPAYNEGKTIGPVLEALTTSPISDIADVLVMNDSSKDNTAEVVKSYGAACITHVYNLGYGCGLWIGYKYANRHGYEYVIQMDADGQHDPCNVMMLYEELHKRDEKGKLPDIVLGSRFVEGSAPYQSTWIKDLAYKMYRFIIKKATGQLIMDPTSGLQGLSKRAYSFYGGYRNFDDKYPDANMLLQMLLLGYNVREVPSVMHQRTEGVSMHSGILKPAYYMIRMFLSIVAAWVRVRLYNMDMKVTDEDTISE